MGPKLRAVCVGINPSPVSVAAGHYYQGRLGQLFFSRLRSVGLLPDGAGYEDDLGFEVGIGFTDIVKKPSPRAGELSAADFEEGRALLTAKLEDFRPELVIFTFKKTAAVLCGRFQALGSSTGSRSVGSLPSSCPGLTSVPTGPPLF